MNASSAVTRRESFHFRCGGDRFLKRDNDFARNFPGHGRPALADFTDGGNEFFRGTTFQKITASTGAQGFENAFGVFIDRDHDDLDTRHQLFQPGGAFDAGNVRQLNVHQDDVHLMFGNFLERFL